MGSRHLIGRPKAVDPAKGMADRQSHVACMAVPVTQGRTWTEKVGGIAPTLVQSRIETHAALRANRHQTDLQHSQSGDSMAEIFCPPLSDVNLGSRSIGHDNNERTFQKWTHFLDPIQVDQR